MTKKGFTLIELLVGIAIIGILGISVANFNFGMKTDIEKQNRFVQKISSMIHSVLVSTSSGRGIKSGAIIMNPTSTHIQFSTGSIGIYYYSGATLIGTGETIDNPFFGDAGFAIKNIYGVKKDLWTGSITSFPVYIVFDNNNNISFSGSDVNLPSYIGIGATIEYHATSKVLEFDRRFGKITIQ